MLVTLLLATLPVVPAVRSDRITAAELPPEGYRIRVGADGKPVIEAADAAGRFYAEQTLAQLPKPLKPCEIEDWPTLRHRGIHLDESRHFFGKETVKRILDRMAQFKLNVLHWHLMDGQGNRFPLKKYPRMNTVGATRWRPHQRMRDTEFGVYGPFGYSPEDIAEVRAYAKARHIRIIPEVEMPGHSEEVILAYPEFACGSPDDIVLAHAPDGQKKGVSCISASAVCLGNDDVLRFFEDVVDEVCELFPDSEVIHIGGDECSRDGWKRCPKCQARMKANGIKDEDGLQDWFSHRIVAYLRAKGRRAAGWEEMAKGDIGTDTLVYSWLGQDAAQEAAKAGREVVMCPHNYCYLDNHQGLFDDGLAYPWWCDWRKVQPLTLKWVHSFDPFRGLSETERKCVIGGQANNWTEFTENEKELQWKMWPRAIALAEVFWSGPHARSFSDFCARVRPVREKMVAEGVNAAPVVNEEVGYRELKAFNPTWKSDDLGTSYDKTLPTAALLGNGALGVVNGGTERGKRFVLTRGDLWSCGSFKYLRWQQRGTDPKNETMAISFADFEIEPLRGKIDYTDELDIETATLRTTGTFGDAAVKLRSWVAADEDVFVIEGVADRDVPWKLRLSCHNDIPAFPCEAGVVKHGIYVKRSTIDSTGGAPGSWVTNAVARLSATGGEIVESLRIDDRRVETWIRIKKDQPFRLVIGPSKDYIAEDAAIRRLRADHVAWWKDWWSRSRIAIGDYDLENYWYGATYLLGAGSRAGKLPPGLYSIWVTKDCPSWNNDYHLNYNYISAFYGAYSSNRPDAARSLPDPLLAYLPRAVENAQKRLAFLDKPKSNYVASRGDLADGIADAALFPVGLAAFGAASEGDGQFLSQNLNGPFSAAACCTCWEYTHDEAYLKQVWPLLDKVANFYFGWCEKEGLDGGKYRYVLYDATNENYPMVKNCAITLACVRYLFETLVSVEPVLRRNGIDVPAGKLAKWRDFAANLSELPHGVTVCKGKPYHTFSAFDAGNGNAYGGATEIVIPGEAFSFDLDEKTRQWAYNGMAIAMQQDQKALWGCINHLPKLYSVGIREGYPPEPLIAAFKKYDLAARGQKNFTIHDGAHGFEKCGAIEFINSMLIQCDHGFVKVFPNWTGTDAKFENLRAKGAFLVSAEMRDGRISRVSVTSEKGGTFRLVNPFGGRSFADWRTGKTRHSGEATLERDMKPGERLVLEAGR